MVKTIPGKPARGTETGKPIMVLLDLLGRRQALRVIWELRAGPLTFRELQASCGGISPTVLNKRLQELRDAMLVRHDVASGYSLTSDGEALRQHLAPLNEWSRKWGKNF